MPRTALLVSAGLLMLSSAWPAAAQTTERMLFASVLDAAGKPVPGLGADAFTVREDGQAREVLRVSRATQPMDLAILVDNSQAASPAINDLRNALLPFLKRMAGGGHQVAIIGLADRPTIIADYTSNAAMLEKGVGRLFAQPGSGTTLLDAIRETSRGLQKRDAERRVMLVITTEGTDFSTPNHQTALDAIEDSHAAMYAMVLTQPGGANLTTEEARNRGIVLDRGPDISGGRREHLLSSMALAGELSEFATELENQYLVVYGRPAALVPPEKIEVAVSKPGLKARGTPAAVKAPAPSGA
jgi:VWFA-related protein